MILDAVSVLGSCDSPLTPLFREMVPDGHILQKVESLEYQDEMGLSAWVGGRRVLIGNRQLMDAYGVELPSEEWEERYTQNGNRVLYLSNSGQAAAMYILSYKADKQMRRALELLCDRDMAVCIYSTDPNVTAEEISRIYDFPKELVAIQPAALHGATAKYLAPEGGCGRVFSITAVRLPMSGPAGPPGPALEASLWKRRSCCCRWSLVSPSSPSLPLPRG